MLKNKAVIPSKKLHHINKACWVQRFEPIEVLKINEPRWYNISFWVGQKLKQGATVKSLLTGKVFYVFVDDIQYVDEYPEPIEIPYE